MSMPSKSAIFLRISRIFSRDKPPHSGCGVGVIDAGAVVTASVTVVCDVVAAEAAVVAGTVVCTGDGVVLPVSISDAAKNCDQ